MEFSLRLGGFGGFRPSGLFGKGPARRPPSCRKISTVASAAAGAAGVAGNSYFQRVKGFQGPWTAACTSGVLSAMGDTLAQFLVRYTAEKEGKPLDAYDPWRTLRMFGFGFCWYGPFQYYWYNALDWMMPIRNNLNFFVKVASNQLVLAPCTLSAVFAWNLALMDRADQIPHKLKEDLVPTMMNGWKFWIPAASINFYCIPIQMQVLYMSCCGLLWTAYLSYASVTPQGTTRALEPAPKTEEAAPASKKSNKKK